MKAGFSSKITGIVYVYLHLQISLCKDASCRRKRILQCMLIQACLLCSNVRFRVESIARESPCLAWSRPTTHRFRHDSHVQTISGPGMQCHQSHPPFWSQPIFRPPPNKIFKTPYRVFRNSVFGDLVAHREQEQVHGSVRWNLWG